MHIRHILPQPAMGTLPIDPLTQPVTGLVNAAWQLAQQQAALGHHVEVVAPAPDGHALRSNVAGVALRWLRPFERLRNSRLDWRHVAPLWLAHRTWRTPDVTHVHGNPFFIMRPRSGARIFHLHSPADTGAAYQRALRTAHHSLCCSRFIQTSLAAVCTGQVPPPNTVQHNGATLRAFSSINVAEARAHYGIDTCEVVALYAGRIGQEKGFHVLAGALRIMAQRSWKIPTLMVAGSATLGYEAHSDAWRERQTYADAAFARLEGLPVRLLGNVGPHELPTLFRAANLFVCPSIYPDPFPLVNVEAAAAGLPIVASSVGGIPEAVNHEVTGLLVPPADPSALADALHRLVDDASLRVAMGQAGLAWAATHDWREIASDVIKLYQRVIGMEVRK